MLYGTGADLENVVAAVLEAAGLNVVKVDELLADTSSADLLVSFAGRRRLIEVKSASGNAAETLVSQLQTHLRTWPQLRPTDSVEGGVLVVNHQYRREPDQRSASVYVRPEFVAALTAPVLSTRQLFDWWRASEWTAIRKAAFGDTGSAEREADRTEPPAPTPVATAPAERPRSRVRRKLFAGRAGSDPGS